MEQHWNKVSLFCQDKILSTEYHKLIPGEQTQNINCSALNIYACYNCIKRFAAICIVL